MEFSASKNGYSLINSISLISIDFRRHIISGKLNKNVRFAADKGAIKTKYNSG